MKILLDMILPSETYFDNYRPDWLKNPETGKNLELDRYYPSLRIGFEFNGIQHRKKISEEQWSRDLLKKKLCGREGVIKLVVYKKELIESILRNKLKDCVEMRLAWQNGKSWSKTK